MNTIETAKFVNSELFQSEGTVYFLVLYCKQISFCSLLTMGQTHLFIIFELFFNFCFDVNPLKHFDYALKPSLVAHLTQNVHTRIAKNKVLEAKFHVSFQIY